MIDEQLYAELWVSLASLLRSYTAAHGLGGDRQAMLEFGDKTITVQNGEKWLHLQRNGVIVNWKSENGKSGVVQLTEHGRLLSAAGEDELDMAAESWARDLMRDHRPDPETELTR